MTTGWVARDEARLIASRHVSMQTEGLPIPDDPRILALERPTRRDETTASFLRAEILPDRGMMTLQITAFVPGVGVTNLLWAPPHSALGEHFSHDDANGRRSFSIGGAILVPYANRIRGRRSDGGETLETTVLDRRVHLPIDRELPGADDECYAIHGLILSSSAPNIARETTAEFDSVTALISAGDFGCGWPSESEIRIRYALRDSSLMLEVTVDNVGAEPLPVGIGWHPYFTLPSGDRTQARVRLPAASRAVVHDYVDVLPTGQVLPVAGTDYDFSGPDGRRLDDQFLDDCFTDIERSPSGLAVAELFDPAGGYRLRIIGHSPEISAFQVFAPPSEPFVVIEPQFNLADPYGAAWLPTRDTGMSIVTPGASVTYRVSLELV
jgi:aldose 1-epimerase